MYAGCQDGYVTVRSAMFPINLSKTLGTLGLGPGYQDPRPSDHCARSACLCLLIKLRVLTSKVLRAWRSFLSHFCILISMSCLKMGMYTCGQSF